MKIEFNNLTKFKISKKLFTGVAKKVITGENKEIKFENLSIAFVSPLEIKKANKKYRAKNKPTDVLSFDLGKIGELVICPDIVKENAKKFGNSFNKEMAKMIIHGIMHLAGYDHEKSKKEALVMESREKIYLDKF